ncbi:mucin-2 protein [Nocardioides immobilis]|uniref:Mucin-2 protein n=1 Tax=Nocardioides immobilis TaxID=2049295 RepID=A0A417XW80_9ACTN|nr:mucin-2 protein [Nocardioides immobilis]
MGVAGSQPAQDLLADDSSLAANGIGIDRRELGTISRDNGGTRGVVQQEAVAPLSQADKMLAPAAVRQAVNRADTQRWTTTELNLWTRPDGKAKQVGVLDSGKKVLVTGRSLKGREEIVLDGEARWVTAGYLSAEKPFAIGGECTNGSSVSPGVSPNIVKVHEAVCANFPEITVYGTFRGDGEHAQGIAVDIMVSGDRGWQVAEFIREHYSELGVSYLIYSQQIWSVERSGEGWRGMEDRGSTTANHYDHVHVTTY